MSIRFVYLDAAGTLLRPEPSLGRLYASACRPHGLTAGPEELEAAFARVWSRREASGDAGMVTADASANRRWWRGLVEEIFDHLGFTGDRDPCFADCDEVFARPGSWHVFSDVVPALETLRRMGLGLGVLSNWDARLGPLLAALGLAPYFGPLVISAHEGLRKPDVRLFRRACQRAGLPPEAILHVGDRRAMDLEPARRAGLHALLVDRAAPTGTGETVLSLREIPERVARHHRCGSLC